MNSQVFRVFLLALTVISSFYFCPSAFAGLAEDGISLFDAGQYREATIAFAEALKKERKNDPNVMYYYGLSLQRSGQSGMSYSIFSRILSIAPNSRAAAYARQAMGLPPSGSKAKTTKSTTPPTQKTTAPSPKGASLPFDCPCGMFPGGMLMEATDVPAKLYGFKTIKLGATTTPEKVIAYYEAEMKASTDWKLREKNAGVDGKTNPQGNKMCGGLTYLSQTNAGWTKQFSVTVEAPELKPATDIATTIEITLFDKSHYQ